MKKLIQKLLEKYQYELKKILWKNEFTLIKEYLPDYRPIVFDIGANVGNYSSKLLNIRSNSIIYAFEPFQESFEHLKAKFKSNKNVFCEQLAVSNYSGVATFNINASSETNSLLSTNAAAAYQLTAGMKTQKKIEVAVTSIDDYCKGKSINQIDLLKIDVQGAEYNVLQGALTMLQLKAIKCIRVEVLFGKLYENQEPFYKVLSHLQELEYTFQGFIEPVYINGKLEWADAFFIVN